MVKTTVFAVISRKPAEEHKKPQNRNPGAKIDLAVHPPLSSCWLFIRRSQLYKDMKRINTMQIKRAAPKSYPPKQR